MEQKLEIELTDFLDKLYIYREETLRTIRIDRGLTLEEVSNKTWMPVKMINKYEINSSRMPLYLLKIFLDLYNVNIDQVFLGKESDFNKL